MGLFGRLVGFDQFRAQQNAVLASHLLTTTDPEIRREIVTHIRNRLLEINRGRQTAEDLIEDLNDEPRGLQMQFVALACLDLGISPNVKDHFFTYFANPYTTRDWLAEKDVLETANSTKKGSGVAVNWPGNDQKFDFAKL